MDYLKETENFGVNYQKDEDLGEFFGRLISFIERRIYKRIIQRVNFLLTRVNDNKVEIIPDGNSDKGKDGNFRFTIDSSGDLIIEENINGTWTDTGWKLKRSP